jgi:hypothetical protein
MVNTGEWGDPLPFLDKSMTDGMKVASLVVGNGVGTGAQFAMAAQEQVQAHVASTQNIESYLRIGLLVGQVVLIVISVIYAYRKLKKKD